MKFIVSRASLWKGQQPCDEAVYNAEDEKWFIELNDFNELLDFIHKYGDIIIEERDILFPDYKRIVIYDDYIE